MVIYSTTQEKDLKSYYNRLQNLLVDTAEIGKLMKPLKVSRKSVVMKSASKCAAIVTQVTIIVTIGTFRLQYEDDYEYEFSVLRMRFRFGGRKFSKYACSELKTRTRSRPRTPI